MRVNKTKLAELLGVTKPRITQYAGKGMPFGEDGKIDPEEARRWIAENLDPAKRAMAGRAVRWTAPDPLLPGGPSPQARAGYLAGARVAIDATPTVLVCLAAERLRMNREEAIDFAEHAMLALWEWLELAGTNAQLLGAGEQLMMVNPGEWRNGLNWEAIFDSDGRPII